MSSVPIEHSAAYRTRRFLNWFPMGMTYAFLYMGRYNLTVAKNSLGDLMTKEDFGVIFGIGALTYGCAFLINGPLVDRLGGRRGILIAALGSAIMNSLMGWYIHTAVSGEEGAGANLRLVFSLLYAGNMYFQSYAAVSIVKVNAHWFHVNERGGFSGIFGTMISSGIFLAFTVNGWLLDPDLLQFLPETRQWIVFFVPSGLLVLMFVVEGIILRDRPSQAGHEDFDTGDASSGEDESTPIPVVKLIVRIVTNPIILTIALIEFCTGVIRNGIMHWLPFYLKEVWALPDHHALRYGQWTMPWLIGVMFIVALISFVIARRAKGGHKVFLYTFGALAFLAPFLQGGWGGMLFVAGVIGGNVAGWVSDLVFQSRRAPAAGGLYAMLTICLVLMIFAIKPATTEVAWARASFAVSNAEALQPFVDRLEEAGFDASANEENARLTVRLDGAADLERFRGLAAGAELDVEPVGLLPGDVILSIGGESELADWESLARAVACVPATCIGETTWDAERCMCASEPERTLDELVVSDGTLGATVLRGDQTIELDLRDPKPSMKAGDMRRLKAGPVIPVTPFFLGIIGFILSIGVIGSHGLLSGTATMDFGGRRAAATAVGIIDGFVYLGTFVQSFALGYLTTKDWTYWPLFLTPFGVFGFILCTRIWHAKPGASGGH
jgi:OPA family glycerol-3-phosphate transporter-like MFS transporter